MDQSDINFCLRAIEQRVAWGSSELWTNHDFELLGEEIYAKTNVHLSITTLKRIWGKVDYQSKPSTSTLNVLAQFLDFKHWRDFQNNHAPKDGMSQAKVAKKRSLKGIVNHKALLILVVLIALSSLFFLIDRRQVFYKTEEVIFEIKKVSEGLPNTVVFDYDVTKVIADSFFIQQSWDRRRRARVLHEDRQYTSFYYYPGFFHAKLIANDHIIKEHELLVESGGWIGMIERFPEPIYIRQMMIREDGRFTADLTKYANKDDHYQDKNFWVDYYYASEDLMVHDANNFDYSCRIKNSSNLGSVCHESRISIMCTRGRFNIPLCQPGCVGNINVSLGDKYIQGKRVDLSALGCDLSDWIDFRLKVEHKKCTIYIDNELKFSCGYSRDLGKIAGFKFKFNGVGEIDFVQLKNHNNNLLFEESFDPYL